MGYSYTATRCLGFLKAFPWVQLFGGGRGGGGQQSSSLISSKHKLWKVLTSLINFTEMLGTVGPQSLALIKDIGRRIASETGERLGEYLLQHLSGEETCWLCWLWGGGGGGGGLVFDFFIITINFAKSYFYILLRTFTDRKKLTIKTGAKLL